MRSEIKLRLRERELEIGREYLRKQEQLQAGSKFQGATAETGVGQRSTTSGAHTVSGAGGDSGERTETAGAVDPVKTSKRVRTPEEEQRAIAHTSVTRHYSLSESRRRILELSTKGYKPREIASETGLATAVVYRHLEALRKQKKIKPLERVSGLAPLTPNELVEQGDTALLQLYPKMVEAFGIAVAEHDFKAMAQCMTWIMEVRNSYKQQQQHNVTVISKGASLVNLELKRMQLQRNGEELAPIDEQIKLLQSPPPKP